VVGGLGERTCATSKPKSSRGGPNLMLRSLGARGALLSKVPSSLASRAWGNGWREPPWFKGLYFKCSQVDYLRYIIGPREKFLVWALAAGQVSRQNQGAQVHFFRMRNSVPWPGMLDCSSSHADPGPHPAVLWCLGRGGILEVQSEDKWALWARIPPGSWSKAMLARTCLLYLDAPSLFLPWMTMTRTWRLLADHGACRHDGIAQQERKVDEESSPQRLGGGTCPSGCIAAC